MSQNRNYDKHQSSKYKKYVASMSDGTRYQADTEKDLLMSIKQGKNVVVKSQQYDPETGKPIK